MGQSRSLLFSLSSAYNQPPVKADREVTDHRHLTVIILLLLRPVPDVGHIYSKYSSRLRILCYPSFQLDWQAEVFSPSVTLVNK